ncbi:helix-turn-helix domain-containing protein [Salinirubellus salinus]|uniref:Helix-turn-helix domain-containing protein n=1 Tax=Salinirubellus salinus TaxID=1364945 RepID=A0A9E7R060_9EURY|nr:helix-turn-helix domain-containing protein [Salinirubellus salinus]UWM53122.1 helix-turn-helix domain-containing protein [Salinirubellus salinus]
MGLLPSEPDVSTDAGPRVVGVDSDDADALLSALSSETARRILARLHEDPAPPSRVADGVDTSLQNVQYHLERLEEAGAVEVVGTAYSEKGREMDLYAPADQPLVIFAGREEQSSGLRAALSRFVGGVGALAFGALLVQEAFGEGVLPRFASMGGAGAADGGDAGSGAGGPAAGTETGTPTTEAEAIADTTTVTPEPTASASSTATSTDGVSIMSTPEPTPAASATPTPAGTPTAVQTSTEVATAAPTAEPTAMPTEVARTVTETVAASGGGSDPFAPAVPPGLLFFLGGLFVLALGLAMTR